MSDNQQLKFLLTGEEVEALMRATRQLHFAGNGRFFYLIHGNADSVFALERYLLIDREWEPVNDAGDAVEAFVRSIGGAAGEWGRPQWLVSLERYGHPRKWPENSGRWEWDDAEGLIVRDLLIDWRPDFAAWHPRSGEFRILGRNNPPGADITLVNT